MDRYVAGDHEDAVARDVVLAPPTCCCSCCCCCTLGVPEIMVAQRRRAEFDGVAMSADEMPDLADAQAVLLGGLARGNLYTLPFFLVLFLFLGEATILVGALGAVILVLGTVFLSVRCGIEYGLTGGWLSGLFLALGNVLAMAIIVAAEVYLIIGLLMEPVSILIGLAGIAIAVWLMRRGDAVALRLASEVRREARMEPVAMDEEE